MNEIKTITKIAANPLLVSKMEENKQLKVAAYCRVSTDSDDQLQSYEAQVAYYSDYIAKNPRWHFVGVYADEGISGTAVKKRIRFQQMIKDCEKRKIDYILTKSVSRFARNTVDSLNYVRKLKAMGIGVYFEEQNIDTLTADSEMFVGLYSVIAQSESENISANVRWGIQQRMKNGTYAFRFNLYGYQKGENGEPEIVENEAETVKKIYSLYLDGYSISRIRSYLNEHKIKNRKGKTDWSSATIQNMLINEKYAGDMLMQKTYVSDCISKKTKKNNGEMPKYLISNNHPAIIDRETFKLVQQEHSRRGAISRKSDNAVTSLGKYSKYALSECLICGECGSPYRRRTIISRGQKRIYWRCLNRIENGKKYCSKSIGVEEIKLHSAIGRALNEALGETEDIKEKLLLSLEETFCNDEKSLEKYNLELNIKQLQSEADMLIENAANTSGDTEKYFNEIEKLYSQIKALKNRLELLKNKNESTQKRNIEFERIVSMLKDEAIDFSEYDDNVIRRIVSSIKVMADKTIIVTLKGGINISEKLV